MKDSEKQYREIFEKSPIGILFYDKEGKLTDANQSALEIAGIPSLNSCIGLNLFENPQVASRKEDLLNDGLIRFQRTLDFDNIKKFGIYTPTKSGSAFIDYTISVIDSGFLVQIQDITEGKKVEEELRESEVRFRSVLDNTLDALYRFNLKTNQYEYLSPAFEDVVGFSPKEFISMTPDETMSIIHPDDLSVVKESLAQLEKDGHVKSEYRVHDSRGKYRWLSNHISLIRDDEGQSLYRDGTIRNITQQKQAEEALIESNKRFKSLSENIDSVLMRYDKDLRVVYLSPKSEEVTGISTEEFIGKTNREVGMPEDLCNLWENAISKVFQTGEKEVLEFDIETNEDVLTFYLKLSPEFNSDGSVENVLGISTDISERRKAEEALVKSEERYRSTLDNMMEGCAILGYDWTYIYVNDMNAQHAHLNREEMIGNNMLELLPGVEESPFFSAYKRCMDERIPQNVESKYEFPDGSVAWYEARAEPVPEGIFVLSMEITERKKAEEHKQGLLEKEKQLSEELQQQMKYEKELINKLKTSNKELEQFAYVASHDLQEPLRMVASFSQLLESRYKDQIDEDADDYIEFIVEGANRMKKLIDDLLAFSRLNTEAKEFKLTDTNSALDDVLVNLNPTIMENNAQITHDPLPIIKVDSSQIRQLFQNLITNAIKFHGDEPPKIHISAEETGKEWLFSVSDNGIGIDSNHLEKIFNVFNRLHTREEYEGTGIGLAICKRIVERHGGKIWVESEPGKGSTFYFTLSKT
jgi:PAS domain S-box-containing protein